MSKQQGIASVSPIDVRCDDVTRGKPLTAGVSCPKVVSMSDWQTSRHPRDIRVVYGPDCGPLDGREQA